MNDVIRVVTVSTSAIASKHYYYRLSLYGFKGDPPRSQFIEDLGNGFWDYGTAIKAGRKRAKELDCFFMEGITMGDSIEKLYKQIFS